VLIAAHRLLGLAFASADLLIEVGPEGKIEFAVGAAHVLGGSAERALVGRQWREFVDPSDHDLVEALFLGIEGLARQGPVVARLAGDAPDRQSAAVAINACRLPQNGSVISCALTRAQSLAIGGGDGGLHDRAEFETITKTLFEHAQTTGQELELAFVEMEGLEGLARSLKQTEQRTLMARLAGALRAQSHGGSAAAQLADERYALVVRPAGESPQALTGRLAKLMGLVAEVGGVTFSARTMALKGDVSPSQILKAIRYALDDFVHEGLRAISPMTLQEAVSQSVHRTMEKAAALGSAVAERNFSLVYQPVVSLKDGELHHHEVLVRFGGDASPFPMIRMAEELDLIEGLDLAILEQAIDRLAGNPKTKLAVNISGRTVTSPTFVDAAKTLIAGSGPLKGRLMFEITESAAIDNLVVANRNIQLLRELGCMVCLDDFGAGAASLAYLQQLQLDLVKIDGRYIRELEHGDRESAFIRQLVNMCKELNVRTLAESVETATVEEAVRRAGVDFAQGWYFGAPSAQPEQPSRHKGPVAARRVGVVESWG
jgi:EAL domain-containing protein (putative c-di-GMP-specific phosphodiesterase class I)